MQETGGVSDDPRIGTVLDGHRIEGRIGMGGMGVVYRARHLRLDREVALKLIRPELAHDSAFRRRFDREMQLAASIDHEHIVTVHSAGETSDGDLYLTMQLIDGSDLMTLLTHRGPYPPRAAAAIVLQVGDALDAAHALGLVHRDVKPGNIMISWRNRADHAYLTDFGVAKRVRSGEASTKGSSFVGTIDYAAPEQIRGEPVDATCDVYALGCVLFRMIAGCVPFPRDTDRLIASAHSHAARPTFGPTLGGEVGARVVAALDAVVARAMAIDPADRYASAGDLGRAAMAAAEGVPPPAPAGSVARGEAAPHRRAHGRGWLAGRRPTVARTAGIAAALVAASAAGFLLAFDRAPRADSSPPARLASADLELRLPAPWDVLDRPPSVAGIALDDAVAATRGDSDATILVAGLVDATGPSLTPLSRTDLEAELPEPGTVELGRLRALRYDGVRPRGLGSPLMLYVLPSDRGVVTVACYAVVPGRTPPRGRCDDAAARLRLRRANALPLGASQDFAAALNRVMRRLAGARRRDGILLRDAKRPRGQALMADRVGRAHDRAAKALARLGPGPADAVASRALVAALRRARDGYADLARAARAGSDGRFSAARRAITRALRRIDAALLGFRETGYTVR